MRALLVVLAHPGDESLRCGGTLALLAGRGVHMNVLTATYGQTGSCGDPRLYLLDKLRAVWEYELRCACGALDNGPLRPRI